MAVKTYLTQYPPETGYPSAGKWCWQAYVSPSDIHLCASGIVDTQQEGQAILDRLVAGGPDAVRAEIVRDRLSKIEEVIVDLDQVDPTALATWLYARGRIADRRQDHERAMIVADGFRRALVSIEAAVYDMARAGIPLTIIQRVLHSEQRRAA